MDAQAGLHLCCLQTPDRFSCVEAQIKTKHITIFNVLIQNLISTSTDHFHQKQLPQHDVNLMDFWQGCR